MSNMDGLRDYYDHTDMSEALGQSAPEAPLDEVLVSTSIRLTKTVMDRVRAHADLAGVPATTLMRQWISDGLDALQGQAVVTVSDLEQFIVAPAHTSAGCMSCRQPGSSPD